MKHFKTTESATVTNYPYGSLKATVTFSLEHKSGKGFRTVFQSINPKNGRLNAPKKSTYYPLIIMRQDENGFVDYEWFSFNGSESVNKGCAFLAEHYDLLTPAQIESIYITVLAQLKMAAYAACAYSGAKAEDVKPILDKPIEEAVKGLKEKINTFGNIKIDIAALDACKNDNYKPFKATAPISLMSMV